MTELRTSTHRTLSVIMGSVFVGALTSWAQGVLPDALASFANSPSGWTVLSAGFVAACRPSLRAGALLGTASFVAMVLGYTWASHARGLAYDPTLWGAVGLVGGPFVGAAAAAAVGRRPVLGAVGAGTLAGVLIADGVYGLTVVDDTTSPVYWTACLLAAALLLLASAVSRRSPAAVAALALSTAAATGAITAGYALLNAAP